MAFTQAKLAHVKIVHCQPQDQERLGFTRNNGLLIAYELRLGQPSAHRRLMYEGQFNYPVQYISADIYNHILTDIIRYAPCLISYVCQFPTFPQDFVVYVYKPSIDLTVLQKRGISRIWAL